MMHDAPGRADDLDDEILKRWNNVIRDQYARLEPDLGSRFFALEPKMDTPQRVAVGSTSTTACRTCEAPTATRSSPSTAPEIPLTHGPWAGATWLSCEFP